MKFIKKKMIYFGILILVGISFIIVGLSRGQVMMSSMGWGLLVVSVMKMIQYYLISKKPEKLHDIEIAQNEERLVFLANRASALCFYAIVVAEYIAMLVCMFINKEAISLFCSYAVCGELILYVIIRSILNRKY